MKNPSDLQRDHPDVHYWLVTHNADSAFARSLLRYAYKKGSLTERQLATVRRMIDAQHRRQRGLPRLRRVSPAYAAIKAMIRNFPQ